MEPTEDVRIGLAGAASHADVVDRAAEAAASTGADPIRRDPAALAEADLDVAVLVGEGALLAYVRADADASTPVLPVGAGRGVRSVPAEDAAAGVRSTVAAVAEASLRTRSRPLLSVRVDGAAHRVLFDAMVVTSEPARISEYVVETPGGRVTDVRADGVVLAAPAGTHGYAAAADGPLLAPGTGVLAVVPVAPFVTDRDRWVLDDTEVTVRVTRDDAAVSVLADDREVGRVGDGGTVVCARDGAVDVAVVPESRPFWPGSEAGLEKL